MKNGGVCTFKTSVFRMYGPASYRVKKDSTKKWSQSELAAYEDGGWMRIGIIMIIKKIMISVMKSGGAGCHLSFPPCKHFNGVCALLHNQHSASTLFCTINTLCNQHSSAPTTLCAKLKLTTLGNALFSPVTTLQYWTMLYSGYRVLT